MEPPSAHSTSGSGESGKLFVGGISWETCEETLKDYFKKYGDVTEAIIMRDKCTGNARGFGFVSFADPSSADRALNSSTTTSNHVILGRTVQVKKALPRGEAHQNHQQQQQHHYHNLPNQHRSRAPNENSNNGSEANQIRTKKIFVGGLSAGITEDKFKSYFEQFGRITDVVVMYDSSTHRPRGFGFITFDSEDSVDKAIQNTFHELNGKSVEVKKAVPKDGNNNNNGNLYKPRMGSGRGSVIGNFHGGKYPPQSSGYGVMQGYHPPPILAYTFGAGGYCGAYSLGPYGCYNFQYAGPRNPWLDTGLVGSRIPASYGNAAFYTSYPSGGVDPYLGIATNGYSGFMGSVNGKGNQNGVDLQTPEAGVAIQSQMEVLKLDER